MDVHLGDVTVFEIGYDRLSHSFTVQTRTTHGEMISQTTLRQVRQILAHPDGTVTVTTEPPGDSA